MSEQTEAQSAKWQARAIYNDGPYTIDIVWDRQSCVGPEKDTARLVKWLNAYGLKGMRREVQKAGLGTSESREVVYKSRGYQLTGNPRASYGYLYLEAKKEG